MTAARRPNRTAEVIREAVAAVAAPETCERVLAEALAAARRQETPETPDRLRAFVIGPLFDALRDALGLATAEAVVDQIGRVLLSLDAADEDEISHIRPASIPSAPRAAPSAELLFDTGELELPGHQPPTDPAPGMVPVVLLASRDRQTLHDLRDGLTGGLDVIAVDDPIALLDALQATPALAVIVVDARNPTVQPATMAAMAPDLPKGVQVLLWGVTKQIEAEINSLGGDTFHWIGCDARTPPEEVAFLCVTMLRDMG